MALKEMCGLSNELSRLLTLPNTSRARHKVSSRGREEAEKAQAVANSLGESIMKRLARLSALCEIVKREGLPPNEATRIRNWERMAMEDIDRLRVVKSYRTPQALRSFSRLFSVFLPPFYAPYYAQLARDLNSLGTALAFATITSLALTCLFETVYQMEDPFVPTSFLDGVQVHEELVETVVEEMRVLRSSYFPEAVHLTDEAIMGMGSNEDISKRSPAIRLLSD